MGQDGVGVCWGWAAENLAPKAPEKSDCLLQGTLKRDENVEAEPLVETGPNGAFGGQ